jgi:hypothetical protein
VGTLGRVRKGKGAGRNPAQGSGLPVVPEGQRAGRRAGQTGGRAKCKNPHCPAGEGCAAGAIPAGGLRRRRFPELVPAQREPRAYLPAEPTANPATASEHRLASKSWAAQKDRPGRGVRDLPGADGTSAFDAHLPNRSRREPSDTRAKSTEQRPETRSAPRSGTRPARSRGRHPAP